jgi:phage I-like protein
MYPMSMMIALDGRLASGLHRVLDGMVIALDGWATESSVAWHQVAVEGKWDGHWMGPFSLNKAIFDQMVQAFEASPIDTVVDYEHASVFGEAASPAAGWIKELQRRPSDDGQQTLWAQVEWTARASDFIRAKEYRYLSPTIVFNSRDRKSGKMAGARLHSVALTNTPFLHELPEVRLNSLRAALTQHQEEDPMTPEQFAALCKALKLDPEKTTAEQVTSVLEERAKAADALALQEKALREAMGVDEKADVVAAARAARVQSTAVPPSELAALRVQVQTLTAQAAQRSAAELVAANQRQCKVQADGTENHKACVDWATRDPNGFAAYMATIPAGSVSPVTGLALVGAPRTASDEVEGSPEFQLYAKQCGITPEDIKAAKAAGKF